MKKIISMLIAAVMLMQLPAFAQENDIHTDDCSDLKAVYERSEYWEVSSSADDKLASGWGDTERYAKTENADDYNEPQYLTYYLKSVKSAEVTFYHKQIKGKNAISIKYSSDNANWTDANASKMQNQNSKEGWYCTKVTADKFPKGTRFVRIEITKDAKYYVCAIGEVILKEGERLESNTVIGEPGENAVVTDPCNVFDMVYDKSAYWRLDGTCFTRNDNYSDAEYITYKIPEMLSAEIEIYYLDTVVDPWDNMKAEFSKDNENWTEVKITLGKDLGRRNGNWIGRVLNVSAPGDTSGYFKLTVGNLVGSDIPWALVLEEFRFTSRPNYETVQGNLAKEGSKVKANFDIPINLSVYDSLTMVLVMQDENRVITGIEQYMFTPEENNVHMEAETEIAENTKTVSAYFWNSIWGMHKVADVQTINV